ncbi:hypothetical protein JM654_11870 [Microbacterium oxydans]|nr:hypothetical protein [Microbacterium oxydans]
MKHEAGKNHALQQQVAGLVAEVSSIKRSRTWVWVGGVTAIGSALAALGTLFFSMAQLAPSTLRQSQPKHRLKRFSAHLIGRRSVL